MYQTTSAFYVETGESFELAANAPFVCINAALDATLSFGQCVMELERMPIRQRKQLAAMAQQGRQLLEEHRP